MSGINSLETGRRALIAQRIGLDVTSNNIANINTPNYTRQQAHFVETNPTPTNAGLKGTGVEVALIDRFRADFVERAIRDNISRLESYKTDYDVLTRAEALINEPTEFGIDESVQDFFKSLEDLQLRPESIDKRQILLDSADAMNKRFNLTAERFDELRADVGKRINTNIKQVNLLLRDIATINQQIVSVQAKQGNEAASYGDRRQQLLEELSEFMNVQVNFAPDNQAYVSINGTSVVMSDAYTQFKPVETIDPETDERTMKIFLTDMNGDITSTIEPRAGEFASLLRHYNVTLDPTDTTGGFSVYKNLNRLAAQIVERVNATAQQGYGLDDTQGPPPGRNFFVPVDPGRPFSARNIALSPEVRNNPRAIPSSDTPGAPGNNVIIRQMAAINNEQSFLDGQKWSEFYSATLVSLGNLGHEASNGNKLTTLIKDQLVQQREEISGVSLDEEAVNLIKFQRAFEAAARVINISDQILQTIIGLTGS